MLEISFFLSKKEPRKYFPIEVTSIPGIVYFFIIIIFERKKTLLISFKITFFLFSNKWIFPCISLPRFLIITFHKLYGLARSVGLETSGIWMQSCQRRCIRFISHRILANLFVSFNFFFWYKTSLTNVDIFLFENIEEFLRKW